MRSPKPENYIETGFKGLDAEHHRFSLGELIIIGGRPAMGKTQLMINLALNISLKEPVLYYTFEMLAPVLSQRMLAVLSSVNMDKIRQNELKEEETAKLRLAQAHLAKLQLYLNDSIRNCSVDVFEENCKRMIGEKGIKVIFIDYVQLMNAKRSGYHENQETEMRCISRILKAIAREHNVCVIASSQLSRPVEVLGGDQRPVLSDLRRSGVSEQDADKVIFLHRPEYCGISEDENGLPTSGVANLILAKNRNGATNTILL